MSWAEVQNLKDKMTNIDNSTLMIQGSIEDANKEVIIKRYNQDYMTATLDSSGRVQVEVAAKSKYEVVISDPTENRSTGEFLVGSGDIIPVEIHPGSEIGTFDTRISNNETAISELSESLSTFHYRKVDGQRQISDDGVTWENFNSGAELLWTNSAPSTAFTSKTISLDLTAYEQVVVEMIYESTNPFRSVILADKDKWLRGTCVHPDGRGTWNASIDFIARDSGVEFKTISNVKASVPTRIFGVKKAFIAE